MFDNVLSFGDSMLVIDIQCSPLLHQFIELKVLLTELLRKIIIEDISVMNINKSGERSERADKEGGMI